jgi:YesK-like protein
MGFYGLLFFGVAVGAIVFAIAWIFNKQTKFHIPLVFPSICFGIVTIAAGLIVGAWDGMAISMIGLGTLAFTILPAGSIVVNRYQSKKDNGCK